MYLFGKKLIKSEKVKIPNSFPNNSARAGPTPFKYAMEVCKIIFKIYYILRRYENGHNSFI